MNDEKTAADYKVQGGSVLHLVLALRGGLAQDAEQNHLELYNQQLFSRRSSASRRR